MTTQPTKKLLVYDLLKKAIISGEIKPGDILNENEVAQRYNVGKTPTREALLLLTHDKLLESMPRLGYVVTRLTTQDLLEIFSLRIILETEAIGLAVERITPGEIDQLVKNNLTEAQLHTQNPARLASHAYLLNYEFHQIIARASGGTRIEKIIGDLIDDLERAFAHDPYIADPSQHVEIIESLKHRDKARAQEAMRAHLVETRLRILKIY